MLTFGEKEIELPLVAGEPARSDEPADAGPDQADELAARRVYNARAAGVKDSRLLAVWCPDWPVIAACTATGTGQHLPVAVVDGNEIVSTSAVARAEGIRRAMRKRMAESICPELVTFEHDPQRDARFFEPVAEAVEELAPGIEVVQPGLVAVAAQGPVSYFDTAERAAERIVDHIATRTGTEAQIGLADSLFAATKAAHRGVIVPPGRTAEFLKPLGVHELDAPELVDLLRRLGLKTLGAFADVPENAVASRFGGPATRQHRLARGLPERPLDKRRPAPELAVTETFDDPVDRIDSAAFAAKILAERLHEGLSRAAVSRARGSASTPSPRTARSCTGCGGPRNR